MCWPATCCSPSAVSKQCSTLLILLVLAVLLHFSSLHLGIPYNQLILYTLNCLKAMALTLNSDSSLPPLEELFCALKLEKIVSASRFPEENRSPVKIKHTCCLFSKSVVLWGHWRQISKPRVKNIEQVHLFTLGSLALTNFECFTWIYALDVHCQCFDLEC